MSRFRPALALSLGLSIAGAGAARADPPLWRVIGPGAEIDLFGSIHLLSDATRWKTPALEDRLAKADAVWFEIPLGNAAQAQAVSLMQAQGMLADGQTLSALLPPSLEARVVALAQREGLPAAAVEHMRPWLVELELELLFFEHQGAREDLGVEAQLNAAAPAHAERGAFETLADQVTMLASDPMAEQIASLKQTLDEIDTDPQIFARMADAWRRGDVQALVREVVTPMRKEDEALYRRLLVERNRRFAARIEQMAQGRQRVFVVVGVGHLVGPDGVPALLRRDGLKVEGP
ncbi:TraB/GumN family protein [Caulobacter sp. S45]|uniref:TraB/GumN family protein n=1 Tax=Caulobacter sp. S45 TaxID=1641861 RepID=UPI001575A21A|nr:TraB/GumN family protein [Caulobacter sp. S45]